MGCGRTVICCFVHWLHSQHCNHIFYYKWLFNTSPTIKYLFGTTIVTLLLLVRYLKGVGSDNSFSS